MMGLKRHMTCNTYRYVCPFILKHNLQKNNEQICVRVRRYVDNQNDPAVSHKTNEQKVMTIDNARS